MTDGVGLRKALARGPAAGRLAEAAGGRAAARARSLLSAGTRGAGGLTARLGGARRHVTVGESVDVGVPVREAYDRWLDFLESGGSGDGPRGGRLLWPAPGRTVRVTERITDDLVSWTAGTARETTRGTATFHGLAENLTRVLLVLECRPRSAGLPAGTGLLRRLRARRARLDLADFQRSVTMGIEIDGGGAAHDGDGPAGDGEPEAGGLRRAG